MQKYKSHKVVEAAKIESIEKLEDGRDRCLLHYGNYHGEHVVVSHNYMNKHTPQVGGYYVRYPDGYESWSPAQAFEEGYTAVDADPVPANPPVPVEQARDPAITALRDHVATEALKSIISSPQYYESTKENDVAFAYKYADLMLAEREK